MKNVFTGLDVRLKWTIPSVLFDYVDDIVLLDTSYERTQMMTETVENEGRRLKHRLVHIRGSFQK